MAYQNNKQKMETKSNDKMKLALGKTFMSTLIVLFISLVSFNSSAQGQDLFKKNCATCHTTTDKIILGPGLKGLSERRDQEWSIKWIRNSAELVESGDEQAVEVFEKFNKIPMQAFPDFSDEDIVSILDFIEEAGSAVEEDDGDVASTVAASGDDDEESSLNTTLLFWGVLLIVITALLMYRFVRKVRTQMEHIGVHPDAHKGVNYPGIFLLFAAIAAISIYVLVNMLENGTGAINVLMFLVLPYLSFGIFIVGTIYRYTKKGYQVSSLSSQFIEGKQLFWGSQPFHWGILFLFVGHLTAFLFPRTVLAWNGEPVRLLILELSSFAFGLAALLGLVLLIKRRLTNKSLLVVTNKMDMVVYVILFTQILSGLGVAFFVRWGSSWFASVLTPYLRSVFVFDPDISAVSAMPWWIQLHIISAFLIIAIIPFTRFMHFLVAPIDYAWRKYQLVVWNWNRKEIRKSRRHTFGKKTRNH